MDRDGQGRGALSRRILIVSHYALPHLGGIEVLIDALARELVGRGHEVVHLASGAGPAPADTGTSAGGYRVIRVPAANALEDRLGVPYPLFSPSLLGEVRRAVAWADVVHAHGLLYMDSVAAVALAGRRPRPPVRVVTEHVGHVAYESPVLDRLEAAALGTIGRWTARAADAVVVYNPKVGDEIGRWAPRTPVRWIANGVDLHSYRPPEGDERARLREALGWDDRPRALFVGRLVAKKGVDVAIAAAEAAGGAFELAVVGPGRLRAAPPTGVTVLGPQSPERVAELYRAADALLLPSRGEGFPVTAQEAMASGLPVVLGDDPAYAPHVGGAGPGVVLARPDPATVAAAVLDVVRDRERRGAAAAAHARRAFSWSRCADEHEELWERFAWERAPGPDILAGR